MKSKVSRFLLLAGTLVLAMGGTSCFPAFYNIRVGADGKQIVLAAGDCYMGNPFAGCTGRQELICTVQPDGGLRCNNLMPSYKNK